MRGGAASNIYVIPAPERLTFNTAMIIAAACCIPAILSVAFTSIRILDDNWKKKFEKQVIKENEPIAGTNGATIRQMKGVNKKIRKYQNYIEVPVFGTAVLAILVVGELNFFSSQVRYQTEPIASVGMYRPRLLNITPDRLPQANGRPLQVRFSLPLAQFTCMSRG